MANSCISADPLEFLGAFRGQNQEGPDKEVPRRPWGLGQVQALATEIKVIPLISTPLHAYLVRMATTKPLEDEMGKLSSAV